MKKKNILLYFFLAVLISPTTGLGMKTTPLQLTRELDELTGLVAGSQILANRFAAAPHDQALLSEIKTRTEIINTKTTTIETLQAKVNFFGSSYGVCICTIDFKLF